MKAKIVFVGFILALFTVVTSCNIIKQSNSDVSNIKSIAWQEDRYLWVSDSYKLVRWNVQTKQNEIFEDVSGELLVDSKNTLWVFGTDIISHFDGQAWEYFRSGNDFAEGKIFTFTEANGYIWVGTQGISRYDQQDQSWDILFRTPPGPSPTPIPQSMTVIEALSDGVHAIIPVDREVIWFGTSRGLTYLSNNSEQTWTNNDLDTDGVRCLLEVSREEAWVCTENGVGLWNGSQWVEFLEGLIDPFLIVKGEGKDIWVVTRESGVARWNGISWDSWTKTDGLAGERPTSLVVSTIDDNVWVGTKTGISRWNGGQWRTYTTSDGLTSAYINVLFEDPTGTLWGGTFEGGVNYYEPNLDQWQPFPGE